MDRFAYFKRNVETGGDWVQLEERDALPSSGDELDVSDESDQLHEFFVYDNKNGHSTAQYRQGNGISDVFDANNVAAYAAPGTSAVNHDAIITARRVSDGATKDFSVFDVHSGTLEEWADGGDVALVLNDSSGNGNDTSAATNSEEPLIVKQGVLVSQEERPGLTLDGSDDSLTASVAIGDTLTVAIDFESAHAATFPATVYSHDGLTIRETATDIEVEITDGTNTTTVVEPKLQLNRVVVTATPSNLYLRVNGEESSTSHSITRNNNSTLDLGAASFEGRAGHAVVYDADKWADRDGLVQGMGGLWSPPERVRWDFGKGTNQVYDSEELEQSNSRWANTFLNVTEISTPSTIPPSRAWYLEETKDDHNRPRVRQNNIYLRAGANAIWAYLKAKERRYANVATTDPNDFPGITVDLEQGVITATRDVNDSFIEHGGNGWYLAGFTWTNPSDGIRSAEIGPRNSGTGVGGNYDNTPGKGIYAAAVQMEPGVRPTTYEKTGAKPQSINPDVGPSKFAFDVGSDGTAKDTNDPWITPDGVKGDGTDDYLTQSPSELNLDRDFTWVGRLTAFANGNVERIIAYEGVAIDGWAIIKNGSDSVRLFVYDDNNNVTRNTLWTASGGVHTFAFSVDSDAQTVKYCVDGGSVSSFSLSPYYNPHSGNLRLLSRSESTKNHSTAEVNQLEHIPRALTDRELRAACNTIGQESKKRNSLTRTYPTYGWDFQESEDNILWATEELDDTTYWARTGLSTVNVDAATDPVDSRTTIEEIVEDSNSGGHYVQQDGRWVEGKQHHMQAVAKANGRNWLALVFNNSNIVAKTVHYDLANGAVGNTNGVDSANIDSLGNSWYRCRLKFTIANGAYSKMSVRMSDGNGSVSYTGDGTSGIYAGRVQLVPATSQVPYVRKQTKQQHVDSKIGGAPQIQLGSTTGADTNDPTWTAEGLKGDGTDDYATVTDASLNPASDFSWVTRVKVFDDGTKDEVIELGDIGVNGWYLEKRDTFNGALRFGFESTNTSFNTTNNLISPQGSYAVLAFTVRINNVWVTVNGNPVINHSLDGDYVDGSNNSLTLLNEEGVNTPSNGIISDLHFYDTALGPDALLHETKELLRKRA